MWICAFRLSMAESTEYSGSLHRQRARQPVSVPFLWEEKPGTPKKEWISKSVPTISVPSPVRLVVSVPFDWEEKPGKPFPQLPNSSFLSSATGFSFPTPLKYSPSSSPSRIHGGYSRGYNPFISDEEEGMFGDLESFAFDVDDSTESAPPLFANSHFQVHEAFTNASSSKESLSENNSNQNENWYSISETDCLSSSNSSATQNTNIEFPVLEFLFPLSPPNAGFLNKVHSHDKITSVANSEPTKNSCESSHSLVSKRSLTLGELILLSRRLSYRRKPVDVRRKSLPMEFIKKSVLGCCYFRTSSNKNNAFICSS